MRAQQVVAGWESWDGATTERMHLGFENGGWTADGVVTGVDIHYVVRLSADWEVRQFLLFRDAEEPDLWLATDAEGNWGEVNGAYRDDLAGCTSVGLVCTPFTSTLPIRHLALDVGESAELLVAMVDPESLQVQPMPHRFTRVRERRWVLDDGRRAHQLVVDEHGLVIEFPETFRRVA
jgi:hypothetical protein